MPNAAALETLGRRIQHFCGSIEQRDVIEGHPARVHVAKQQDAYLRRAGRRGERPAFLHPTRRQASGTGAIHIDRANRPTAAVVEPNPHVYIPVAVIRVKLAAHKGIQTILLVGPHIDQRRLQITIGMVADLISIGAAVRRGRAPRVAPYRRTRKSARRLAAPLPTALEAGIGRQVVGRRVSSFVVVADLHRGHAAHHRFDALAIAVVYIRGLGGAADRGQAVFGVVAQIVDLPGDRTPHHIAIIVITIGVRAGLDHGMWFAQGAIRAA